MQQRRGRTQVLLVEGSDSMRRALARTLRLAGYGVHEFPSIEALCAGGGPPPAGCLLLDIDLPGLARIALGPGLFGAGRAVPAVFVTSAEDETAIAGVAGLTPVTVLRKPFDRRALLDALALACG